MPTPTAFELEANTQAAYEERKRGKETVMGFQRNPVLPEHEDLGLPPLTAEQEAVIEAVRSGRRSITVTALAGTGKTTTLRAVARAVGGQGMLYLAFNRRLAEEARERFPGHVRVSTVHGMAYAATRPAEGRVRRLSVSWVRDRYRIRDWTWGRRRIRAYAVAALVVRTAERFMQTTAAEPTIAHVPDLPVYWRLDDTAATRLCRHVVTYARALVADMLERDGQVPITHDTYLRWAWEDGWMPPADLILFDEAQDASPLIIDLVNRAGRVVWVGDPYQQIYDWRGAVSAFDVIEADAILTLTQSFRFGESVARLANCVLAKLGEHRISGLGGQAEGKQKAILCRSNAGVAQRVMDAAQASYDSITVVGADRVAATLRDLALLRDGGPGRGEFLGCTWDDIVAMAEADPVSDAARWLSIEKTIGLKRMLRTLEQNQQDEATAAVVISTVHQAKGREWPVVHIHDDWQGWTKPLRTWPAEELRLLYVAVTRGMRKTVCETVTDDHRKRDQSSLVDTGAMLSDASGRAMGRGQRRNN